MKHLLRKIFFFIPTIVFVTVIFSGLQVDAQETGYKLLAPIPTIVDQNGQPKTTGVTLVDYMKGIFVATIGLAIVLAVIEIVIGGIEYVAAAVPSSKEDAKKRIGGAVMGLLLILLAWVLLKALNPALLNVGLNLEKVAVVITDPGPGAKWCIFNSNSGQRAGGPEYNTEAECKAEISPGLLLECHLCGWSKETSPACEDIAQAKARLSGGGTVCNGSGSCKSCDTSKWDASIKKYSTTYNVPEKMIRAILARESSCGTHPGTYDKSKSADGKSCGIMQVVGGSCENSLQADDESLKQGTQKLAQAYITAKNIIVQYGNTVTLDELAAAIYNAGASESSRSIDCTPAKGWAPTFIPKWGCPVNPGEGKFNACAIRDYACDVGACI